MYDVIIIGGGTAGGSAAIFAAKAGKSTLILDSNQSMTKRAWMLNHYGIKEIAGPDLIAQGLEQAASFGAEYVEAKVTNVTTEEDGIIVHTEGGDYTGKHVLLATGALTDLANHIGLELKEGREPRIKTVIAVDNDGRTNLSNIWAAGTVAGTSVHTIITAGDGAKVAINIISALNGERYVDHDVLKS